MLKILLLKKLINLRPSLIPLNIERQIPLLLVEQIFPFLLLFLVFSFNEFSLCESIVVAVSSVDITFLSFYILSVFYSAEVVLFPGDLDVFLSLEEHAFSLFQQGSTWVL